MVEYASTGRDGFYTRDENAAGAFAALYQSMEILQMSLMDLQQLVKQELSSNPTLRWFSLK